MRVLVWGLGPVGAVSAASLANRGHRVTGIDRDDARRRAFEAGDCPIREPGLAELVARAVESGLLDFAADGEVLVAESDISLVCVGAPGASNGRYDMSAVEDVGCAIGKGLSSGSRRHLAVLRSTVHPGATRGVFGRAIAEAAASPIGERFQLAFLPEFLREGSAVSDFEQPSLVVVGADDPSVFDELSPLLPPSPPTVSLSIEEAELAKLACNAFHAAKVGFANEIGRLARLHGCDGRRVMEAIALDRRLNSSAAYLAPGLAFGGPCLPKDLRALAAVAADGGEETPLLDGILRSNERQHSALRDRILASGARRVSILGLAFKGGTDDMRESPAAALAVDLASRGIAVLAHDFEVSSQTLADPLRTGGRAFPRYFFEPDLEAALRGADVVVVTQKSPAYREAVAALLAMPSGARIFDAVRLFEECPPNRDRYEGIAW